MQSVNQIVICMKKVYWLLFLFSFLLKLTAQPPQKMSYQAVIRDASNNIVPNRTVGVEISILQLSPNGLPVYLETHRPTTNANGLLTIEIGTGTACVGCSFNHIDWSAGPYYIKMSTDLTGGQVYTLTGTQQILSIPYALYAEEAANVDYENISNRPVGQHSGDIMYWNSQTQTWDILPVGLPGQYLVVGNNGTLAWNTMYVDTSEFDYVIPKVRTYPATDVQTFYAVAQGAITDIGQSGIIAAGFCWSLSPHPVVGSNHTSYTIGFGYFSGVIGDSLEGAFKLLPDTTYYYRAYATNTQGTGYGEEFTFRTKRGIITLSTEDVSGLTCDSLNCLVTVGIDIQSAGNAKITDCGIVYSNRTHYGYSYRPTPTSNTSTSTISGTYYFVRNGQVDTTTYYRLLTNIFARQSEYEVYAFAKNRTATCTFYGDKKTFKTPYRVGDLFSRVINGTLVEGIIFEVTPDEQHGKMIMLDQVSRTWRTTANNTTEGTNNLYNGIDNLNVILGSYGVSGLSNYPAFEYCYNKHPDHQWYLPAIREFLPIHTNFAYINGVLTLHGTPIAYDANSRKYRYWSSTEPNGDISRTHASTYKFVYSMQAPTDKANPNEGNPQYDVFVRCIRTF